MPLPADILLSLKYLRPKRTFISMITLLSVLGPILGVALLVIVIAVMSGFDRDIRERILGMQAHLQLTLPYGGSASQSVIARPEPYLDGLHDLGIAAAPLIEGPVLLQQGKQISTKYVRGIVPHREKKVTDLKDRVEGRFHIREGEALIGGEMALELGVGPGDTLLVHSPAKLTENITWREDGSIETGDLDTVYLPEEVTIAGVFNMGVYEYDSAIMFMRRDQAAELFGLPWGSATVIRGRVPDPFRMASLVQDVQTKFPGLRVVTWQQANRQLFDALRVEKNLMFFLLTFIVIVAAFGIAGTLITVVVQKTREIGILKAVGLTSAAIARIFLVQGAAIGVIGTVFGSAAGLLVIYYRDVIADLLARLMGVEVFPKELYHLTSIPARVTPQDVLIIAGIAFIICVFASLIPAVYASCLSPAAALREEN